MRSANGSQLTWGTVSGHRSGGIDFKRLLQGTSDAPDNFELSLVRTGGDYYTPRHRHNFDQVRLCLEGTMNYSPGRDLKPGAVGYFPEGTFYGPQQDTVGSIVLLLQMGGAGGYGFMSYQQLNHGYQQLSDLGNFDHGVFTRAGADGETIRKDGYEAIWEYVNRREIKYPRPRFEEAVVMHPENFNWIAAGAGFETKQLGSFAERGLSMGFIRGERGARHTVGSVSAPELWYVKRGSIRALSSGEQLETQSAFRLDPSDVGATFEVLEEVEMFHVRMPEFG